MNRSLVIPPFELGAGSAEGGAISMEEEVFGADDGNVRAVSEAGRVGSGP